MRYNLKNNVGLPNAKKYEKFRQGNSIRCVCQIDGLGVEYALYRNRPIYVFKKRAYVDEFIFIRYVLTSFKTWNRWVKHATRI